MPRILVKSWRKKDFSVATFKSGGKGGQHQNKTDSGVRITHLESNLSAECRETRSQHENKKRAFRRLVQIMIQHYFPKIAKERAPCTERIRTYHAIEGVVYDHRTGGVYNYDGVMNGNLLGKIIDEVILLSQEKEFANLQAKQKKQETTQAGETK